jgi:hypothetical protein
LYTRGGPSVWGNDIHSGYGQPPCDYYLEVMRNFRKVRVIGDFMNPCVNVTLQAGAVSEEYDDRKNLAVTVHAKYIVLASSSRSHAVIALSRVWKRFWMFDQAFESQREYTWWKGHTPLEFGDGQNCVATEQYKQAMFSWNATPLQIALMLNSTCVFEPTKCLPDAVCPPSAA